jgi:hypothetical protein
MREPANITNLLGSNGFYPHLLLALRCAVKTSVCESTISLVSDLDRHRADSKVGFNVWLRMRIEIDENHARP